MIIFSNSEGLTALDDTAASMVAIRELLNPFFADHLGKATNMRWIAGHAGFVIGLSAEELPGNTVHDLLMVQFEVSDAHILQCPAT
jgi:hypothetical protein